jgi:hypothetical protein
MPCRHASIKTCEFKASNNAQCTQVTEVQIISAHHACIFLHASRIGLPHACIKDLASFEPGRRIRRYARASGVVGFAPTTFGTSANLVHRCIQSSNDNLDVGSPAHTSTHICARVLFNSIIIRNRSLKHPLTWKHNSGVKMGMDMHANWCM